MCEVLYLFPSLTLPQLLFVSFLELNDRFVRIMQLGFISQNGAFFVMLALNDFLVELSLEINIRNIYL